MTAHLFDIKCSIYYGDSLSLLVFCIGLNPIGQIITRICKLKTVLITAAEEQALSTISIETGIYHIREDQQVLTMYRGLRDSPTHSSRW